MACGFAFSRDGLTMLAPELRARIAMEGGWPVLDRWFHSSVPQISLVGFPAEGRYGAIARFVGGATFAAERIAEVPAVRSLAA